VKNAFLKPAFYLPSILAGCATISTSYSLTAQWLLRISFYKEVFIDRSESRNGR